MNRFEAMSFTNGIRYTRVRRFWNGISALGTLDVLVLGLPTSLQFRECRVPCEHYHQLHLMFISASLENAVGHGRSKEHIDFV